MVKGQAVCRYVGQTNHACPYALQYIALHVYYTTDRQTQIEKDNWL